MKIILTAIQFMIRVKAVYKIAKYEQASDFANVANNLFAF